MKKILEKLNNPNTIEQMENITSFRDRLQVLYSGTTDATTYKDVIFLDIALEYYQRSLVEKVIHIDIGLKGYFRQIELLLENLVISFDWKELEICKDELKAIKGDTVVCDKDYFAALKVKGVVERIKRCLGEVVDRCFEILQPRAVELGTACKCDKTFISIFSEDVIRGSLFFALSMVIKKIEPILRKTLGVHNWLLISPVSKVKGKVVLVQQLRTISQEEEYKIPTIILTEGISGEEEVPTGVQGIVLINNSDYPDVLAHVSVRARNGKVLLAVCLDISGKIPTYLNSLVNKSVQMSLLGVDIEVILIPSPLD
jgi:alpha-glucan,water dikinase